MKAISLITGSAVCLVRDNIDTDAIIPSREIRSVSKNGLGASLFAGWRYIDTRKQTLNPKFPLNHKRNQDACILLSGKNFGCGSSREHAVWALKDYGFEAIIASSFGRIFRENCICNGILPAVISEEDLRDLANTIELSDVGAKIQIDLARQVINGPDGKAYDFEISAAHKKTLFNGIDQIMETQEYAEAIDKFRNRDRNRRPWAYL